MLSRCGFRRVGDHRFEDKGRYPSTVAFGDNDYTSRAAALVKLMDLQGWRNVMLVCDKQPRNPQNAFFLLSCENTKTALLESRIYVVRYLEFDPKVDEDYSKMLQVVQENARSKCHAESVSARAACQRSHLIFCHDKLKHR